MIYGEAFENSSACKALLSCSSFMYAPPHSRPSRVSNQYKFEHLPVWEKTTLKLNLVLNNEGLSLIVDFRVEFG